MEVIELKALRVLSPFEQQIDFTEAAIVIDNDATGLKSWIIELAGPASLATELMSRWEMVQLTAETEDGRALQGAAFVKSCTNEGSCVQVVIQGTGPLTPRPL